MVVFILPTIISQMFHRQGHFVDKCFTDDHLKVKSAKEKYSNVILSCLPTSSKQLLFDNKIILPSKSLSKYPTYNYVSFSKFLRVEIIDNIINVVFKEDKADCSDKINLLEQEIYKLFISQCEGVKELDWRTSQPLTSFPGAITFFSQLCALDIDLYSITSDNLYEIAQICKGLSELIINSCSHDIPGLISLIDAQKNLKSISFDFNIKKGSCEELSKALARKGSTINYLSLYGSVGVIPHSFLTSFTNLKDLTIYYDCESCEEVKEFQKYLAKSNFPELQFLEIDDGSACFKELAMLIEKTKGCITDISVYTSSKSENTGMLLKAISNHCPNIKNLNTHIGSRDLVYVKSILMNCGNLTSLCLNSFENSDILGDELLEILTRYSPKDLTDITISGYLEYSINAFIKFFDSYKGRRLLYFYINNYNRERITSGHLEVVNKYHSDGIIISSNLLLYDHL
ncbi:20098_t:CDS:2 [Rhizophagus irregularis]|nr:20098_t:CDS:2 [Rhizophagus irregularis]